jgi:two-component system, chemotaxis family, chemotaxis protein CheY
MHICVIDDSNSARFMATKVLRELGYKNVTALDSAEAGIEKLKTEQFDLILLDWNLGGMCGLDFLKHLRSDRNNDKTAVIMVTTVNEKSNVIQALKVGIQGYIFKPITAATAGPKIKEIEAKQIAEAPQ